ncbi:MULTISPECIES: NAD(P)-dependent oxidoreductase [Lysinibacillus]|uniref:NAD(P)-dependent oxidoreductase n=1 Tax=Lysinibacillus antri TaxID=2498145 RepID=A0A3S0RW60_9BACI|nr:MULTISPECIES: NAD(P)H-binding protein [Lysinibacillus]RUL53627.1 NAD(P)-dependent oxidoreductase [Lysinibacillus antri]TSI06446.1 NAD(P)-dependent oxidoreductase [Lysinibacillus sp. BW-2-10]
MKIGIIGASGKAGSNILAEAKMRNHEITAFVRNRKNLLAQNITVVEKDAFYLTRDDVCHLDVLINAFGTYPGEEHLHVELGRHLIFLLENTDTKLFVCGGAGSLYIDKERKTRLIDNPNFPEELKITAAQQLQNLIDLQNSSIKWTFLSSSALFDSDGPRTGHYIVGHDRLLLNSQQLSYVSYADYAVAVLDEIENPLHENKRFTVASENATAAS